MSEQSCKLHVGTSDFNICLDHGPRPLAEGVGVFIVHHPTIGPILLHCQVSIKGLGFDTKLKIQFTKH